MLSKISDKAIATLFKIAKNPEKGAYPFFRNPKAMIALREENEKRKAC